MRRIVLASVPFWLLLSSCAVGPNYKRPAVPAPAQFRGVPDPQQPPSPASLADVKWFDLFKDDQLQSLVRTALQQNYDLRIASARVLQARAQYGITRSALFPEVTGNAGFTTNRGSSIGSIIFVPRGTPLDVSYTQAGFGLSWELDLWGRIRRLTESARAQYLATEEARNGVVTTLVSDVTGNYFTLREADLELEIAQKTRDIAQRGLQLTTLRRQGGVATSLDVRQAEQILFTAGSQIAAAQRQIEQTENLLSLLTAQNPQAIPRGKALTEFAPPPEVPAGLPSDLLRRRPDIREAEANLIAANANIGAARALYFPQIALTSLLGAQSRYLTSLFTGPARNWSFAPAATLPIFNAGRIRSGVQFSEAQQQEALAAYEQSIQSAFREVSDALVGYRRTAEQRGEVEKLVQALRDTDRLSNIRYRGGIDSYLQVLDAQRNLFQGELDLARLRRDELLSIVTLYRALGGGW